MHGFNSRMDLNGIGYVNIKIRKFGGLWKLSLKWVRGKITVAIQSSVSFRNWIARFLASFLLKFKNLHYASPLRNSSDSTGMEKVKFLKFKLTFSSLTRVKSLRLTEPTGAIIVVFATSVESRRVIYCYFSFGKSHKLIYSNTMYRVILLI